MASKKNTQTKGVHGLKVQSEASGGCLDTKTGKRKRYAGNERETGWDSFRSCKYCRLRFQPKHKCAKDAQFCCTNHRKRFHETGRMPFYKLMDRVESIVAREVAVLAERLEAVERILREVQGL